MKGKIVGSLFALPFFSVGIWMLWSISATLVEAWQMQDWVPTEARLTRGGYETHTGDDALTFEAFADYIYDINGRSYAGSRVTLNSGADNIGRYQRSIGHQLESAVAAGDTIQVFVDPQRPANAIIDRSVRWRLLGFKSIFVFAFGGLGLGLLIAIWKAPWVKDPALPRFRDAPWLLNDDWQTANIRSTAQSSMHGAWIFAALWSLIAAPLPFVVYDEIMHEANYLASIGLLFPVVGAGLIVWALRRTLEWTTFGPAPLHMDPFPGSIGGHVGGTIDLKLPYDTSQKFAVTLTCVHSYMSGSGEDRSRRESALWQEQLVAHAEPSARGTRLTMRFDVPAGQHESSAQKADSYYLWRLNLSADLPGSDLDRDYELPVYATATQSRFLSQAAVDKSHAMQRALDDQSVRRRFNLESTATGKRLFYPAGRHIGAAITGCLVGGIFIGAGWFLVTHAGHAVFGGAFAGIGSLVTLGCLYALLNSLEVIVSATEIVTVRRLLGIPIRRRSMPKAAFVRFGKDSSFRSQSGGKHVIYYSVQALDRHGSKLVLGDGFAGEQEANAAIQLLGSEFGLSEAANDPLFRQVNAAAELNALPKPGP